MPDRLPGEHELTCLYADLVHPGEQKIIAIAGVDDQESSKRPERTGIRYGPVGRGSDKALRASADHNSAKRSALPVRGAEILDDRTCERPRDGSPRLGKGNLRREPDRVARRGRRESLPQLAESADLNRGLGRLEDKFELRRLKFEQAAIAEGTDSGEALERLHKVRLAAKELRYVADAAAFALDGRSLEHRSAYKDIQQKLGEINDIRFRLDAVSRAKPGKSGASRKAKERLAAELEGEMKTRLEELELAKLN